MAKITRRTAMGMALAASAGVRADDVKPKAAKKPAADPYADAKLVAGPPPLPEPGSFTLAVLPDTQHYSEKYPATFAAQTAWIAGQREARRIAAVLHLGDITNRNTPAEWANAAAALKTLDGAVPFFPCVGNHDYGKGGGCADRTTLLNDYLPIASFRGRPSFGGVYDREPERMENSFHTFSAGGRDLLALMLEFGPRKDVVRWANEVVGGHPKRGVILVTHAFIYHDSTRYDWRKHGAKQAWNPHAYALAKNTNQDVSDGEELWQGLVARHGNVLLTLNGHVLGDGLGRVDTATPGGRVVPQALVNFQMRPRGGDGWLRLLEFKADGRTVEAYDCSPTRQETNYGPENRVTFRLAPVA